MARSPQNRTSLSAKCKLLLIVSHNDPSILLHSLIPTLDLSRAPREGPDGLVRFLVAERRFPDSTAASPLPAPRHRDSERRIQDRRKPQMMHALP